MKQTRRKIGIAFLRIHDTLITQKGIITSFINNSCSRIEYNTYPGSFDYGNESGGGHWSLSEAPSYVPCINSASQGEVMTTPYECIYATAQASP